MAALFERARGFAFEVDEEEVGLGFGLDAEELAKVVIAMDADALAEESWVAVEELDAREKGFAVGEEGCGELDGFGGEGGLWILDCGLKGVECGGGLTVDAFAILCEVFGGGWLGGEGGCYIGAEGSCRGGEGEMEFGGATADEFGGGEIGACVLEDFGGWRGGSFGAGCGGRSGRGEGCDGGVEVIELVEGPGPAVALIGSKGLEEGEGGVVGGAVDGA